MAFNWQDFVNTVGISSIVSGGVGWLIKKKLEISLQNAADVKIENLRNSLQMTALEHQVRFSKLHERRAKVIAKLYTRLVDVFYVGDTFISHGAHYAGQQEKQEEFRKALDKIRDFWMFVERNQIYLPVTICSLLDTFIKSLRKPIVAVGVYNTIPFPNEDTWAKKAEAFINAFKAFEQDIPAVRKALEEEFRSLLDVAQIKSLESATTTKTSELT